MQVLDQGGVREPGAAANASAPPSLTPGHAVDTTDAIIIDHELEIRASHITAAAVAAAAVTAAVATTLAADDAANALATSAASATYATSATAVANPPVPVAEPMAQAQIQAQAQANPRRVALPPVRAMLVSLLTLACIGLALWWSSQWSWPQRALKPVVPEIALPSLRPPVSAQSQSQSQQPALSSSLAPESAQPHSLGADDIARLQEQAEDKAHQLATRRAQAQARRDREDAALAQREQRRRQAQSQLDAARERAERAQAGAAATAAGSAVVDVPVQPSLAEQLQQCNALSLFARERCLWKLCDGKWGQGACPSYQQSNEGA